MSTENNPLNKPLDEDPAQRDARAVKRWYPLSFVLKLLVLILIVLAIMFAIFLYAAGTESGTKFILEKISAETGIEFKYGSGNLRDGLWIDDIDIKATEEPLTWQLRPCCRRRGGRGWNLATDPYPSDSSQSS